MYTVTNFETTGVKLDSYEVWSIRFTMVSGTKTVQLQGTNEAWHYPSTKRQCPVSDFHRQVQGGRKEGEKCFKKKMLTGYNSNKRLALRVMWSADDLWAEMQFPIYLSYSWKFIKYPLGTLSLWSAESHSQIYEVQKWNQWTQSTVTSTLTSICSMMCSINILQVKVLKGISFPRIASVLTYIKIRYPSNLGSKKLYIRELLENKRHYCWYQEKKKKV